MTQSLKRWFADAHEGVSNHPQTADFILPRMALSVVDPRNDERLRRSCHARAARAIAEHYNAGTLKPNDRILMIGTDDGAADKTIIHTILTSKEGKVKFDSLDYTGTFYDPARHVYDTGENVLPIRRDTAIGDFFSDYVSKITVAGRPVPPAP